MNINEILKNDYDLLCKEYKKATKKIEKLEKQKEYLTTQQLLDELQKRLDFDANVSEELATEINELQARTDKAIEQLQIRNRQNESALTNREETIISKHELLKREIIENDFLIGLLKGSDKE